MIDAFGFLSGWVECVRDKSVMFCRLFCALSFALFLLPDWLSLVTSLDCVAAVAAPYFYKIHGTAKNARYTVAALCLLAIIVASPKLFVAHWDSPGLCAANTETLDRVVSATLIVVVLLVAVTTVLLVVLRKRRKYEARIRTTV